MTSMELNWNSVDMGIECILQIVRGTTVKTGVMCMEANKRATHYYQRRLIFY